MGGIKTIEFDRSYIDELTSLSIGDEVFNTEGSMFLLDDYKTSKGKRVLFKYLEDQDSPRIMQRKEDIIDYLADSKYSLLDELVIPEFKIKVDEDIVGFGMEYVEDSHNLGSIINSDVSFKTKKDYLTRLGLLIDKVDRVDEEKNFFFGDLNEFNFVVDKDNCLRAIDLDSSYVEGLEGISPPSMTYYILRNYNLWKNPLKYRRTSLGIVIPNRDSDLYSYLMIILKTISNNNMHDVDLDTYNMYLSYLESVGIDRKLIEMFRRIYTNDPNLNPVDLIYELDDDVVEKSDYKQFQKTLK